MEIANKRQVEYIDRPEAGDAAGEIIANPKMPQEEFFEIVWKEKRRTKRAQRENRAHARH